MKRSLMLGVAIGACVLTCVTMPSRSQAGPITFTLNCTIVDANICTPGGPFGTVQLTDNGNLVNILITLTPGNVDVLTLNWNPAQGPLPASNRWSTPALPGVNITAQLDDSGPSHRFDIRINPDNNPTPANPLSFSLLLDNGSTNLDASFFNVKDDVAQLYAGVVVLPNGGPAYGALTSSAVPEPASLLLLGAGLVGLVTAARRRRL